VITVRLSNGGTRRVDAVSAAYEQRGLTSLRLSGVGGGWSERLVCRDADGKVVTEFAKHEVRDYTIHAVPE
jgi:hypothetical protein